MKNLPGMGGVISASNYTPHLSTCERVHCGYWITKIYFCPSVPLLVCHTHNTSLMDGENNSALLFTN